MHAGPPRGFLMALKCTNTTQSRADPHSTYPHSAWQQLPQLRVQEGITSASHPCLEFLGYLSADCGFLGFGQLLIGSGSSCCAQLIIGILILVWRGICFHLGLGCRDGNRHNVVAGRLRGHDGRRVREQKGWRPAVRMAPPLGPGLAARHWQRSRSVKLGRGVHSRHIASCLGWEHWIKVREVGMAGAVGMALYTGSGSYLQCFVKAHGDMGFGSPWSRMSLLGQE